MSRRAVGLRWHDDAANTIVLIYDNMFLEARLEVASTLGMKRDLAPYATNRIKI
jgi:hypothetical protein